jgi:cyclopropane fatty-acyl-phospholipid synthase-like methyltransferase
MSLISPEKQMRFLYGRAARAEDLPWHRDEPPRLLEEAVASRPDRGRALDLGCGSGIFSVYLARQGFEVTGIDFMPEAIRMSRERAAAAGVETQFVEADLLRWEPESSFELVFDRGTLNLLRPNDVPEYRTRLLSWLAPGGDYVLAHALKRHPLDWRPVGPNRRNDEEVRALFEPELELRERENLEERVPLPVGPRLRLGVFWFHRAG